MPCLNYSIFLRPVDLASRQLYLVGEPPESSSDLVHKAADVQVDFCDITLQVKGHLEREQAGAQVSQQLCVIVLK